MNHCQELHEPKAMVLDDMAQVFSAKQAGPCFDSFSIYWCHCWFLNERICPRTVFLLVTFYIGLLDLLVTILLLVDLLINEDSNKSNELPDQHTN